jgi:hypothetical protein
MTAKTIIASTKIAARCSKDRVTFGSLALATMIYRSVRGVSAALMRAIPARSAVAGLMLLQRLSVSSRARNPRSKPRRRAILKPR